MSTQLMNCGCFDSDAELFEQSGDIGSNDELICGYVASNAELFENCAALGSALHCCELVVGNLPQFSEVYNVCSLHPV